MPTYRELFIRNEGAKYDTNLDNAYEKDIPHAADAIQQMLSSLKINGKKTDIFNLASERVRKLSQDFINSRDEDMRLFIKAHDYNIKL